MISPRLSSLLLALAALAASPTPSRADDESARLEARALVREGNRLLDQRDAAGALSLFNAAYAKFPSGKILVSIGSAEKELGHTAAAANAYARYLASGDDDAARVKEVKKLLAGLDRDLGRMAIAVTPADAEMQLADGSWVPIAALAEWRAEPGETIVRARRAGYTTAETRATVVKGQVVPVPIALAAAPAPPTDVVMTPPSHELVTPVAPVPVATSVDGRFGVAGKVVVDGKGRGAAGVVGAVVGLGPISVDLAAIVGPTYGAYGGLRLALTRTRLRPVVGAGVPVFFDDGARIGARAAGGIEWRTGARLRVSLEVGAEYLFTRGDGIDRWLFAPALSAEARL